MSTKNFVNNLCINTYRKLRSKNIISGKKKSSMLCIPKIAALVVERHRKVYAQKGAEVFRFDSNVSP